MQAPECKFRLPNGHKCRCVATRNQPFCRHHGPKSAGPPPLRRRDRYSRLARWAQLSRTLPWIEPSEIPFEIWAILHSLLEDDISDREAGRLLRALLQRHGDVPFPLPNEINAPPAPASPEPTPIFGRPHSGEPFNPAVQMDLLANLHRQSSVRSADPAATSAVLAATATASPFIAANPASTSAARQVPTAQSSGVSSARHQSTATQAAATPAHHQFTRFQTPGRCPANHSAPTR
jgi:hypothetical protein